VLCFCSVPVHSSSAVKCHGQRRSSAATKKRPGPYKKMCWPGVVRRFHLAASVCSRDVMARAGRTRRIGLRKAIIYAERPSICSCRIDSATWSASPRQQPLI
jgi:hypothetical protein